MGVRGHAGSHHQDMGWQHRPWGFSKEMAMEVMGTERDNPPLGERCAGHPKDWVKCWTSICQKQFKSSCSHHGPGWTSGLTPPSPAPGDAVI